MVRFLAQIEMFYRGVSCEDYERKLPLVYEINAILYLRNKWRFYFRSIFAIGQPITWLLYKTILGQMLKSCHQFAIYFDSYWFDYVF